MRPLLPEALKPVFVTRQVDHVTEHAVASYRSKADGLGEDGGSVVQIGQAGGKGGDSQVRGQRVRELKAR